MSSEVRVAQLNSCAWGPWDSRKINILEIRGIREIRAFCCVCTGRLALKSTGNSHRAPEYSHALHTRTKAACTRHYALTGNEGATRTTHPPPLNPTMQCLSLKPHVLRPRPLSDPTAGHVRSSTPGHHALSMEGPCASFTRAASRGTSDRGRCR